MKQRDALLVLGTVMLAVGVSAILLVSSLASGATAQGGGRPRIFFDPRNTPPPGRTVIEVQRDLPVVLQPIVPVQRGLADTARDAAGYLLILLSTSAALVLAHEQVVSTYRASLGGWRAQVRVLATGLAVIGTDEQVCRRGAFLRDAGRELGGRHQKLSRTADTTARATSRESR